MPDGGSQRLFGDDLGQDHVLGGVFELGPGGVEAGGVRGEHVTASRFKSLGHLVVGIEGDRFELHPVGAEVVGQVEFGGGTGLDTDRGAVELFGAFDSQGLGNHEALSVIVHHSGKVDPQ